MKNNKKGSDIVYGVDFIYNKISNSAFGVKLAYSFGSITRSNSAEIRDVIVSSNPDGTIFGFHGIKYSSPNTFDLIVFKEDGTYIDEYEERRLKKWLMSGEMHWLQINQDTLSNISFYCVGIKAEIINVGSYSGGMLITFQCDSQGAWSNQITKTYTTVDSALNFKLRINTDFDDEIIKPILTITANSSGNVSIKNVNRDEEITINNCENGEVIVLDSFNGKISTTSNILLVNRWNKRFLKLQDSINEINLLGDFTLKIQYRQRIRIRS